MTGAYYNENDPKAAAWLRELIAANLIAPGDVDERSIEDVRPEELSGYDQHHFFAGIGGWSYALRLAGWPDHRPAWTGSCPCQPFSQAGNRKGIDDPRHLWPIWRWLVDQCRPAVVFGEQVASPDGRRWLAGVFADLEVLGYQRAGADLCAAGVGAPHIRQRLFWVGNARSSGAGRDAGAVPQAEGETPVRAVSDGALTAGTDGGLGESLQPGLEGHAGHESDGHEPGWIETHADRPAAETGSDCWRSELIPCADGKSRRIEPGLEPLVNGLPGRVGLLRGYGNAIIPHLAAEFIMAAEAA